MRPVGTGQLQTKQEKQTNRKDLHPVSVSNMKMLTREEEKKKSEKPDACKLT